MPAEEDDVWDYKPIKRGKKSEDAKPSKSSIIAHKKGKTLVQKSNPIKSKMPSIHMKQNSISTKNKTQVDPLPDENVLPSPKQMSGTAVNQCGKEDRDAVGSTHFCPSCQMPFRVLRVQSPRWHVMECMDLPINASQECPAGLKCDDTTSSHYRKFRHTPLADLRSGVIDPSKVFECNGTVEQKLEPHEVVDHAKRKLNFSSTKKTIETNNTTENSSDNIAVNKFDHRVSREQQLTCDSDVDQAKKKLSFSVKKNDQSAILAICDNAVQDIQDSNLSEIECERSSDCNSGNKCTSTRKRKFKSPVNPKTDASIENTHFTAMKPFTNTVMHDHCEDDEIPTKQSILNNDIKEECNDNQQQNTETKNENGRKSDENIFKDEIFDDDDDDFFSALKMDENCTTSTNVSKQNQSTSNSSSYSKSTTMEYLEEERTSKNLNIEEHLTPSKFGMVSHSNDMLMSSQNATTSLVPSTQSYSSSPVNTQRGSAQKKSKSLPLKKDASQTSISSFFKPKFNTKSNPKESSNQGSSAKNDPNSYNVTTDMSKTRGAKGIIAPALTRGKTVDTQTQGQSIPHAKPYTLRQASSSTSNKAKYSGTGETNSFDNNAGDKAQPAASTSGGYQRKCPFYKKMPGTPFTVDAFRYGSIPGCSAYFLTHFHYDHYGGLRKSFSQPIYCTKETANLVEKKIKVDRRYLKPIALNTPTMVNGVEVIFMDANHCPGSVIILFKLPDGRVYLHTGDFRATPAMQEYPELRGLTVNQLYLDTTYCDPSYAFPPQDDVIRFAVNTAADFLHEHPNGLIAVGSYTIGKERIFMGIAESLNCKVSVAREKMNILECLEDDAISRRITLTKVDARVHVLAMKDLNYPSLSSYLDKLKSNFDAILAFEPTGWTHSSKLPSVENIKPKWKRDKITLYGVPYSEHSSYTEMKEFCQFIKADTILPTVNNGNPQARKKMEAMFQSWMTESPSKQMKQQKLGSFFAAK